MAGLACDSCFVSAQQPTKRNLAQPRLPHGVEQCRLFVIEAPHAQAEERNTLLNATDSR